MLQHIKNSQRNQSSDEVYGSDEAHHYKVQIEDLTKKLAKANEKYEAERLLYNAMSTQVDDYLNKGDDPDSEKA